MKKFVYLCGMMLLSMNMMAQIDLNDRNWDTLFFEDFSGIRGWDSTFWEDKNLSVSDYKPLWRCFVDNLWGTGVTWVNHKKHIFQGYNAYQLSNARFCTDSTMKLVGDFKGESPISCGTGGYYHAPWLKYCHYCDHVGDDHPAVHYFSGMIETIDTVGYGYYEIKCKMPVHPGTHDAFWFWGNFGHYEEIDVFEHSARLCDGNITKGFHVGLFYNDYGPAYEPVIDSITGNILDPGAKMYAHMSYHSEPSQPLDEYHTYGCLWLPERVEWYYDGVLFNEETNPNHIPQHPMWLKIEHYQDDSIIQNGDWWRESDEMTIKYVKALRLNFDCNTDEVIRSQSDLDGFIFKVKHSITIGGLNNTELIVSDPENITLRAVESITIDGAFEVPFGACMTLITQNCPQCSTEGVVMPQHNCGMKDEEE